MKKVSSTPKDIAKRRLAKNPIMKIALDERINVTNKENENPEFTFEKTPFRKKDRVTDNFSPRNPFDIPQIERLFTRHMKPKKDIPEPFIMGNVHTICDIDNTFYKVIEGRPLRRSDDIKVYMTNIRDLSLFKANAAYLLDRRIQIDTAYAFETHQFNKIDGLFTQCKDSFVKFAKHNYHISKKSQMIAEVKALQLERKSEELDVLCEEFVRLRNKLADITLTFENLSRYRHFLNRLTPIWWTAEKFGNSEEFFVMAASNYKLSPQISFRSGGSIQINRENITCLKKVESRPYYVEPSQLLDIFEDVRKQCLNYLNIAMYSANILTPVLKSRDTLKAQVEEETIELQSFIDTYKTLIEFEEEKEATYKNIFEKILLKDFHKVFASFDVSKLFTCVQYVNTKLFGNMEDPNDKISTLMYNLERYYLDLTLNLDGLDVEIVKKATKQAFDEDKAQMKRAYLAQRVMKECDILSKSLYTSFEPPRQFKVQSTNVKKNM